MAPIEKHNMIEIRGKACIPARTKTNQRQPPECPHRMLRKNEQFLILQVRF